MLTLPLMLAAISAGLIGGFHCLGMCGGLASMLGNFSRPSIRAGADADMDNAQSAALISSKRIPILPSRELTSVGRPQTVAYFLLLHCGRLSTYMLIGAMFGGMGAASLQWKTDLPVTQFLFVLGNLALVLLGFRLVGLPLVSVLPAVISERIAQLYGRLMSFGQKAQLHPYLMGMAWGGLPCGLSYAIAPFALLSGAAWSGAVLMLLFGLAALPHLLIAQTMSRHLKQHGVMRVLQSVFGILLVVLGCLGLFYFDMKNMPDVLCITPNY